MLISPELKPLIVSVMCIPFGIAAGVCFGLDARSRQSERPFWQFVALGTALGTAMFIGARVMAGSTT